MAYSLEQIASLIGAKHIGNQDSKIDWILTDSRSLCFPEESLFFALKSNRNDGHHYIPELYQRGVRNFVVSAPPQDMSCYADANFLVVLDPLKALQRLAERHREAFNIPIIGITGSNGKTVVKEWLYQILSDNYVIARSPRSYNSQIGVPLSIWNLNAQTELGIFEAGISQCGEMEALQTIIQPQYGIFTSLGNAHQENFVSMDEKCHEKLKLFKDAELLIYNEDNTMIKEGIQSYGMSSKAFGWSFHNPDARLFVRPEYQERSTALTYRYQGTTDQVEIPFIDEASITDATHCLAMALYLNVDRNVIRQKMAQLEPIAMRLEVIEGKNGCTLINDSYNSDFNALDIALDFMNRRPDCQGKERTVLLSDLCQTGEKPEDLYGKVATLLESRHIKKVIGVGEAISQFADRFPMEHHFFATTDELIGSGLLETLRNEVILIKGARTFRFDELTELLELKVHETILEIDLNAVVENMNYYRSFMKPETKMVCMVKASAYGAGAIEIAKTLQDHHADYLAVAVADEGADLRKAGIKSNIMIMNPEMTAFKTLFEYELEPEVYSFRLLDALIHAAEKEGITNYPIHIKLDTGMHRLGFDPYKDMEQLIEKLKHQTAVIPRSVFSHFVGSDADGFDEFSKLQYERFLHGSDMLQKAFPHKILRHICNSAGIEHFPERHLDMVRLGLGLYGINSRNNETINHVSTLRTTILQIHDVPKEETVGYSRKGILHRDSRIAALPIGYADGLNRKLGCGHGYCLVNGQKAPYVGNICMDVCMIDVTDIDCKEGDSVEIFGKNLPVTVLSDLLGTIPYEILTGISTRVKRVYFQG